MQQRRSGYVAFSSLLVITAFLLVLGTTASLVAINSLQGVFQQEQSGKTQAFVESCVEETLLRLNENGSLPSSVTLPEGTCTVTLNSQVGTTWDFTVVGTLLGSTRSLSVVVDRSSTIAVTSWIEQ